jgi:hypothetical protein
LNGDDRCWTLSLALGLTFHVALGLTLRLHFAGLSGICRMAIAFRFSSGIAAILVASVPVAPPAVAPARRTALATFSFGSIFRYRVDTHLDRS